MPIALKLRPLIATRTQIFRVQNSIRMSSTSNEYGQGESHATDSSAVPHKAQEAVPKDVEQALPDSVHPTSGGPGQSTNKTHAKDDGEASIVPKKIQEKLPESVERAVPNVIHDTGDK